MPLAAVAEEVSIRGKIPADPALAGLKLYTAFVTLSPRAPSGIESISHTAATTVQ